MRPTCAMLSAAALLSACAPMNADSNPPPASPAPPAETPASPTPEATCDAAKVQNHLGHTLTPAMTEQIRLQAGANSVRVIAPDSAVTMDYRPDRLNIEHDARMKVLTIRCG